MLALIAASAKIDCDRHGSGCPRKNIAPRTKRMMPFLLILVMSSATALASSTPRVSTAQAEPRAGKVAVGFFASVEAIHDVAIRSAATGILKNFHLRPGDHVNRGEQLGYLGGANFAARLASARAAETAARKNLILARDRLRVDKARYPLLIDKGTLDKGKLNVARAHDTLIRAQETLNALRANGALTAPVAGTVTRIMSGDGERVRPDETLLTLQPHGRLWLVGSIFAKDMGRVRVGMLGQFNPAGGSTPIPVRVIRVFPRSAGDGLGIGLASTSGSPGWFSGEGGMVTLDAKTGTEPAVPDSALVLDQGDWWVIRDSAGHLKPIRVVPDGSHGGWTWISAGLKPGTSVVVSGAYLLFHKTFARRYSGD